MTHAQLAKTLGVPSRTLHRYKKKPGWPETLDEQRQFVATMRGPIIRGRGANSQTKPVAEGTLQARKLEQEVIKLELLNGQRTEKILAEARADLKEEAERLLARFAEGFREWADRHQLPAVQRRELNGLVAECLAELAQVAE